MNDSNISTHESGSPAHSKHHHWRRRALALSFVSALVFGTIGYKQYDPETPIVDALYYAAQLFAMHAPHLDRALPWTLELGRWLAAVTTVFAAFEVVQHMWREEWDAQRIRRMKGHTIICGLGRKGFAVASSLAEQSNRLVVIEKSPSTDMIEACREKCIHVLTGDATNPDVLCAARIEHAASLLALCPDDSTNCEIAAQACHLRAEARHDAIPLQCRIQVGDAETRETLQRLLTKQCGPCGASVRFFDSFDPEARQLIIHGLPLDHDGVKPGDTRRVHLVVLGFGRMGRTLAIRAAQLGVFAQAGRLKISVIDRRADAHRAELLFRYPRIPEVCDIEFHTLEAISPEARALLEKWCLQRDTITSAAVCFDNEPRALEIAVQLEPLLKSGGVRFAARMSGQGGLAHLMKETGADKNSAVHIIPFGMIERASRLGCLADDPNEQFARQIHAAYVKMRRNEAGQEAKTLEALAKDPALRDWDSLTEELRESNRQQADHIFIKMRALGLEVVDTGDKRPTALAEFTREQIEMLAEMEHRRWLAERRMANWTCAPQKNIERRENPYLVEWDKLSEAIKDYDRVAVKAIPTLLAGAQRKICRKKSDADAGSPVTIS